MFVSGSKEFSRFGSAVSASFSESFRRVAIGGGDFLRIRVMYDPSAGTVILIPSASRHSQTLLRLSPASSAALMSAHNARIWAAFVEGFLAKCREADATFCRFQHGSTPSAICDNF
jgi:hypothetical protein